MENGQIVARLPDDELVTGDGHVALVAAGPRSREPMHVVTLFQNRTRLFGVFVSGGIITNGQHTDAIGDGLSDRASAR